MSRWQFCVRWMLSVGFLAGGVSASAQAPEAEQPAAVSEADVQATFDQAAELIRVANEGQPPLRDFRPDSGNRLRIEAALEKLVDLEFIDTELQQAVAFLSERYQIPIIIDSTQLTLFGVEMDTPINLVIADVSLRSALDLILEQNLLDYVFQNEVLKVTTRESADELYEVRVYDVRQLAPDYRSEDLARVIRQVVRPESWRSAPTGRATQSRSLAPNPAGTSRLQPIAVENPQTPASAVAEPSGRAAIEALTGCLVVSQSQRAHREIAEFLRQFETFASVKPMHAPAIDAAAAGPAPELRTVAEQVIHLNASCIALEAQLLMERQRAEAVQQAHQNRMAELQHRFDAERERQSHTIEQLQADLTRQAELLQKAQ